MYQFRSIGIQSQKWGWGWHVTGTDITKGHTRSSGFQLETLFLLTFHSKPKPADTSLNAASPAVRTATKHQETSKAPSAMVQPVSVPVQPVSTPVNQVGETIRWISGTKSKVLRRCFFCSLWLRTPKFPSFCSAVELQLWTLQPHSSGIHRRDLLPTR